MTDTPASPRAHPLTQALCSLLLFVLAAPLGAAVPDVRVLIDVSGSMRQTDPENLRRPALRLLTELLPNGSGAGVWLFAEGTEPLAPPGKVDAKWKARIRGQLERIQSRGAFTDIEQGIATAIAGWDQPDETHDRSLILLTDGLVDVSKEADKSAASRERIVTEQIKRLQSEKVKVHAIALSDKVDIDLLRLLSTQTGGWMEVAKDAGALQRTFLHMLEQSAAPTTVPLQGNHFDVDNQVSEFTLLAFHGPSGQTSLVSPKGETLSALAHPAGVSWRAEADYDLVTLTAPSPGRWTLNGVSDPDNRVVVVTDLGIDLGALPNTLASGEGVRIDAWLTEHGQPIKRRDFLALATAEATVTRMETSEPGGAPSALPAAAAEHAAGHTAAETTHDGHGAPTTATPETHADAGPPNHDAHREEPGSAATGTAEPGRFKLALDEESGTFRAELNGKSLSAGVYQLQVTIDGGTFKRQASRRLKIAGPPLDIRYDSQLPSEQTPSAMLVMTLTAEPDLIDPKTLGGYLLIRGPSGHDTAIDVPPFAKSSLVAKVPITTPGGYSIHGRLMARSLTGEPMAFEAPPGEVSFAFDPPKADHDEHQAGTTNPLSWLELTVYLAAGNAILGVLLGLTWWLLRKPAERPGRKTGKRKGS